MGIVMTVDSRVNVKESENLKKYQDIARELKSL